MFQPRSAESAGFDPDELGAAALTAFFNITAAWHLGAEEERILLGAPPRSTFFKWKSDRAARLSATAASFVTASMQSSTRCMPSAAAAERPSPSWRRRNGRAPASTR